MTFVVANLHGDNAGFQKLLQTIKFKDSDLLYVLGDSVDFGEESMDLLTDMSMRVNVYPLAGEHDLKALRMLTGFEKMLGDGSAPTPEFSAEMTAWAQDGGMATLTGYRALDSDMREGVLDYLSDFMLCDEVKAGGKTYFLAHAGLSNYDADKFPEDYEPEEVFDTALPGADFFKTRTLIVGHAPTASGKIERRDGVIYLDCGAMRGGRIGCLCLETGEEYYV
jgi:serine/threonine protein phosphatase 1